MVKLDEEKTCSATNNEKKCQSDHSEFLTDVGEIICRRTI
jgi:hypothetical protein